MNDAERADFVSGYTKVLTNAWASPDFRDRLKTEPQAALSENGLTVPADAKLEIISQVAGEQDLDAQVKLWEQGAATGDYRLYVPDEPEIDTSELSDRELEGVAGGDSYCCSCSPCCTST